MVPKKLSCPKVLPLAVLAVLYCWQCYTVVVYQCCSTGSVIMMAAFYQWHCYTSDSLIPMAVFYQSQCYMNGCVLLLAVLYRSLYR